MPEMPTIKTNKSWVELRVEIHPSLAEAASNFLIEQGSPGITQEDVKGGGGIKKEALIAYYPDDRAFPAIWKRVKSYLRSICKSRRTKFIIRARTIQDEKWAETWKENFKPIEVTPRLVIKPPWEKWHKKNGQIVIEIEPGMAFGTGTHPTTQMCLQLIEEVIPSFPKNPSLLDVGTGSGILAIAARKLGARKISAIDIDPVAIDCARTNARANGIRRGIAFRVGSLDRLKDRFDMVIANLLPQELLRAAPALPRLVAREGVLIISGFLPKQKKEISAAFGDGRFGVRTVRQQKGWAAFVLKRGLTK